MPYEVEPRSCCTTSVNSAMGLFIGVERETVIKVDACVTIARQLAGVTIYGNERVPVAQRGIHPCLFGTKCLRASQPYFVYIYTHCSLSHGRIMCLVPWLSLRLLVPCPLGSCVVFL